MIANNRPTIALPSDMNYTVNKAVWETLKASNHTCECCGFQAMPSKAVLSGYMQVINGEVYCAICSASQQLQQAIMNRHDHGFLIATNDMSQSDVSNLCREIGFIMVSDDDPRQQVASQTYERLLKSELEYSQFQFLSKQEPSTVEGFANCLEYLPPISDTQKQKLFGKITYVPNFSVFRRIYSFWKSHTS
ncbi:hypothetical protein [Alteromonas stellipolaris]|uniref:hypothetical protein n=1 Tax=Alteromonas stellipolaris TaxID=233316 RepID=UPI001DA22316|nr:hypothetical protein [Alteromonas stellipolaris]MBZ2164178.1 hypothetical protein [Alteromonas stellipolaris]